MLHIVSYVCMLVYWAFCSNEMLFVVHYGLYNCTQAYCNAMFELKNSIKQLQFEISRLLPQGQSIPQRIFTFPIGTSTYWSFFFRRLVHSVHTLLFASRNIPAATSTLVQSRT
jgi:hypothetical protein